jgi:signal transduction histidine kinase
MAFDYKEINRKVLIVDDNEEIHKDIKSILVGRLKKVDSDLLDLEQSLFGDSRQTSVSVVHEQEIRYTIDDAFQGQEAVEMVDRAARMGVPYSMAFMDVRMPPGIDGIQTIKAIWANHPYLEIAICTAYSDYSWDEIIQEFGCTDRLLFLKKPFDATAVKQMALSMTSKWQLQQESVNQIDTLEKMVRERTAELMQKKDELEIESIKLTLTNERLNSEIQERRKTQEELVRAKNDAESASLAKSEFLANMSHEIRTPMNAIIGMTELALEHELKSEVAEYLKVVQSSSEGLLSLINDILDFSKIEAGQLELEKIPFNLVTVLDGVTDLLGVRADDQALEMLVYMDPALPVNLKGDPTRLRQILVNLGANAIKFTEEGEVVIRVQKGHPENALPGLTPLHFSVSDTGIGIPQAQLDRIFSKFSQADSSMTRKFGGTGLGLSISKSLVELMGGDMWVESEIGVGSTFHFTMALLPAADNRPGPFSRPDFPGVKVLAVDDNATCLAIMEKSLKNWGMDVTLANCSSRAIELLKGGTPPFRLVFLDHQMPEMDGLQVTRFIKEELNAPDIDVIMMTSWGGLSSKFGPEDDQPHFITKPLKQSRLYEVIATIMGNGDGDSERETVPQNGKTAEPIERLKRILLVEDNSDNQKLATRILEKAGYAVEVAPNGKDAVDTFTNSEYDVVLMDIQMPVMDGFEATRLIRHFEQESLRPRTPIIALTAHALEGYREKCLKHDMDGYVTKPLRKGVLLGVVQEWIEGN